MAVQTDTIEVRSRPSLLIFIGIGFLLFLLLIGGLWWAKNRSENAAQSSNIPQTGQHPQEEHKPAEEVKPTPAPAPQTQGTNNTAPSQNTQPAPTQSVPSTGPSDIPATGPSARDIVLSSVLMGMAGYFAFRLVQIRRSIQP